jgi:pilus assembly protein CpaB
MSILCGTSAAVGVNVLIDRSASQPQEVKKVSIVVAAVDIPRGTKLKPEFLKTQAWPADLAPVGSIREMEKAIERTALTPLVVEEVLLESKLAEGGTGGAAALVKPGMRAYTISTNSVSAGVAGMVQPGNRVDVLLTVKGRGTNIAGGGGTWILLQNVEVLAANQRLDQGDERKTGRLTSVTLHVTPEMATKLTLAQTAGTLNLTLRNDTDESIAQINPVTIADLQFLQEYLSGAAVQPAAAVTEGVQGQEPLMLAAKATDAPRDILALRGNSASLVRISASSTTPTYLRGRLGEVNEE